MSKVFGSLYFCLAWTITIQVLLCLPGNSIPSTESFGIPSLDKVAHVIIFGGLVIFWCLLVTRRTISPKLRIQLFFVVFLAACANGIGIEFVQKYFIPNRSFDQGDIIADLLSASIAYGICNVRFIS